MDGNIKNTPPIVQVPLPEDRPRFEELRAAVAAARQAVEDRKQQARGDFDAWLAQATPEALSKSHLERRSRVAGAVHRRSRQSDARSKSTAKIVKSPSPKMSPGKPGHPAALRCSPKAPLASSPTSAISRRTNR